MLVEIEKIKVTDRIRKDFGNIEELANDIKENGLINPPVVSPEMQLLAGERRLLACKKLGWKQIEVRVMTVRDAEHQLNIEINENENRKDFTFSEKLEWARRLERIERVKSEERKKATLKQYKDTDMHKCVDREVSGITDEIVAEKSGFGSREKYRKAKFIAENADPETIAKLDADEISIHRAWKETKARLEAELEAERKRRERAERSEQIALKRLEEAEQREPKVIERVVMPEDKRKRMEELERKLAEVERERNEIEASLAETYERLQELQKRDRVTRMQNESPLYDIYRSLSASNGYLKAVTQNERFAEDLINNADPSLLDRFTVEIKQVIQHVRALERLIDNRMGVIVIDDSQQNLMEVVAYESK